MASETNNEAILGEIDWVWTDAIERLRARESAARVVKRVFPADVQLFQPLANSPWKPTPRFVIPSEAEGPAVRLSWTQLPHDNRLRVLGFRPSAPGGKIRHGWVHTRPDPSGA